MTLFNLGLLTRSNRDRAQRLYEACAWALGRLEPSIVAGTRDRPGCSPDGVSCSSAQFRHPTGVVVDPVDGSVIVSDSGNNRLVRVNDRSDRCCTVAGSAEGASGFADGVGTNAKFSGPGPLLLLCACDSDGALAS